MVHISRSNKIRNFNSFQRNESGWADFFITRIGLILFAAILFLAAYRMYPMFDERESRLNLDAIASDIVSKVESVDSIAVPGYKYNYLSQDGNNINIEISSEFITVHANHSNKCGEMELLHAEPIVTHVYPPNSKWNNTSDFRKYIGDNIGSGRNGDASSPLDMLTEKEKIDALFESARKELAISPFIPDPDKTLFIEKVRIYYSYQSEIQKRDYVFIYQ